MNLEEQQNMVYEELPVLNESEERQLLKQDSRGFVSEFYQQKLEQEAAKNWDKFYKRNETRLVSQLFILFDVLNIFSCYLRLQ